MDSFIKKFKRMSFDIVALISLILIIFLIPSEFMPINLFGLVITKFFIVSAAVIHAHITRKLLFPYIKFATEKDLTNNIMVIAWYVIIIFGWTRGG